MRRLAVSLLTTTALLLTLSGCGGSSDTAKDSSSSSPSASKGQVGDPVAFTLVGMVTETATGGGASSQAVPLTDDDDVDAFTAQFRTPGLASKLHDLVAATKVPDGKVLYAAVVYVGCVPPTNVTVALGASGLTITPVRGAKQPNIECLAAMTTVAVVLVDESVANG